MILEDGVSETIGVILLIGIIVTVFGIFGAIYIPMVKPIPIPQVKMSIACSDNLNDYDKEFPCTLGSFNCHPLDDPFDNSSCEADCRNRYYAQNPDSLEKDRKMEIYRCLEDCLTPLCSDLSDCDVLYICHNGGEILKTSNMRIIINGEDIGTSWKILQPPNENFIPVIPDMNFGIGETLQIQNPPNPVDTVMVAYRLDSGGEVTLVLNQFGTDVN